MVAGNNRSARFGSRPGISFRRLGDVSRKSFSTAMMSLRENRAKLSWGRGRPVFCRCMTSARLLIMPEVPTSSSNPTFLKRGSAGLSSVSTAFSSRFKASEDDGFFFK